MTRGRWDSPLAQQPMIPATRLPLKSPLPSAEPVHPGPGMVTPLPLELLLTPSLFPSPNVTEMNDTKERFKKVTAAG